MAGRAIAYDPGEVLSGLVDLIADRVVQKMGGVSDGKLLTTSEAAKATGMSVGEIRAAVKSGELACVRVGRVFKFLRKDLDAWIERNRTE